MPADWCPACGPHFIGRCPHIPRSTGRSWGDPHDFTPDPECSTEQERAAHKAACDAYDRGDPAPEDTSEPAASILLGGVVVPECRQPWGLGTYTLCDPDVTSLRDRIDAALEALDADDDLTLPVQRCPGIDAVAREVLGLPWALTWTQKTGRRDYMQGPWWLATDDGDGERVVPLSLPAGRLVAETWLGSEDIVRAGRGLPADIHAAGLYAACLFRGDLLRVCAALGVAVPAGTVPRLERITDGRWWLDVGEAHIRIVDHGTVVDDERDARTVRAALAGITDPREALDAIAAEVLRG